MGRGDTQTLPGCCPLDSRGTKASSVPSAKLLVHFPGASHPRLGLPGGSWCLWTQQAAQTPQLPPGALFTFTKSSFPPPILLPALPVLQGRGCLIKSGCNWQLFRLCLHCQRAGTGAPVSHRALGRDVVMFHPRHSPGSSTARECRAPHPDP